MINKIFTMSTALLLAAVVSAQATPNPSKGKNVDYITIREFGQTWKVTKNTAIERCNVSTNAKHKNWAIYCRYIQPENVAKKNDNDCQILFWQVSCVKEEQAKVKEQPKTKVATFTNTPPKNIPQVAKAESMIGLSARKDKKELETKFAQTLGQQVDPTHIPWCAAWANMVLADVGMQTTGSLMARSFLDWGKQTNNPSIGDVVVMRRGRNRMSGHVGFFYGYVEHNGVKQIAVLGGNQSKQVRISYYPISKVIAYRTSV